MLFKMKLENSPTQKIEFKGFNFFLKRDDLLSKDFSGNKARKFFYLLKNDFPEISQIVSRGSNQSNSMYSLSVLAKLKGWKFIYFVHHLPKYLKENPIGNFAEALKNGMEFRVKSFNDDEWQYFTKSSFGKESFVVDEGGREEFAKDGIYILGEEILKWAEREKKFNRKIFLPSGTGTTALFLQEFLKKSGSDITVLTTACVGDEKYLEKEFKSLLNESFFYPKIIKSSKKYHFGKLYLEFYKIWLELQISSGVEFELLYDPKGWITLLENIDTVGENSLYIHQGGLLGM